MRKVIVQNIDNINTPKIYTVREDEYLTLILTSSTSAHYQATVKLIGRGAEAEIFGIILGSGAHEIRINTLQDHQAPFTRSNLLIKSVLTDRCQLFYEGFIKVEKNAQRTDAYQRNENLMLSPEAKAESKPALEILANDVRCTHSATIGKINPEERFYLESRGIDPQVAANLIVQGFFQPILEKINDDSLRQQLLDQISSVTRTGIH